ncbi:MAG: rod shape-determining protein MreC [Candidatus Symbiodolus clandestinus]
MKPLFSRRATLQLRLLCALLASGGLMIMDRYLAKFSLVHYYLTSATAPFYYIANQPWCWLTDITDFCKTQQQLHSENRVLQQTLLLQQSELLLLKQLKEENHRLHQLLNSTAELPQKRVIAHLLVTQLNVQNQQLVLDKGSREGVYLGQPVINGQGVVGQVVAVNYSSCQVLLISDPSHAIPVRIVRNHRQTIARGGGELSQLQLDLLPLAADIQPGDELVTSGLDGHFPEGYPVATINQVMTDPQQAKLRVKAQTAVAMEQLHSVLLLWPKSFSDAPSTNH